MLCPNCKKTEVLKARVVDSEAEIFVCPHCDIAWLDFAHIGVTPPLSLAQHMAELGRHGVWSELEVKGATRPAGIVAPLHVEGAELCKPCEVNSYSPNERLERIAVLVDGPLFLHRCKLCGALWEESMRSAYRVTKEEALKWQPETKL